MNGLFVEKLLEQARRAFAWGQRPRVRALVGGVLILLALGFLTSVLVGGWVQVRPYLAQMKLWYALAGQLCAALAFFLSSVTWHCTQRSFGIDTPFRRSIVVHMLSNATKYIPGYGWHYMSKAYLSREAGARQRTVAAALATELLSILATGALIAALLGVSMGKRWALAWDLPSWLWATVAWGTLAVVVALLLFLPRLVQALSAGSPNPSGSTEPLMSRRWLLATLLAAVVGWLLYALSTWMFARSLYPVALPGYWQSLFALAVGSVVSLLVIVVPVGLGVRETTMSLLLVGFLPLSLAVVVSIVTRLSVMLSELIGFLVANRFVSTSSTGKTGDNPYGVSE